MIPQTLPLAGQSAKLIKSLVHWVTGPSFELCSVASSFLQIKWTIFDWYWYFAIPDLNLFLTSFDTSEALKGTMMMIISQLPFI